MLHKPSRPRTSAGSLSCDCPFCCSKQGFGPIPLRLVLFYEEDYVETCLLDLASQTAPTFHCNSSRDVRAQIPAWVLAGHGCCLIRELGFICTGLCTCVTHFKPNI
ncbi:hypothetical protein CHARACLAT_021660 [Characodon lateralis]|uniref:Uncharacterized protein n=1 Tax=Characodon lateralis TaxID=208331 RepID=A0ABU7DT27_9TELE|nr:hypothetical protein [Characodon lateralis]